MRQWFSLTFICLQLRNKNLNFSELLLFDLCLKSRLKMLLYWTAVSLLSDSFLSLLPFFFFWCYSVDLISAITKIPFIYFNRLITMLWPCFALVESEDLNTIYALFLFSYLPQKPNLEKFSVYSNKFFHNFHLSESSFICPRIRASGLARRLLTYLSLPFFIYHF